MYLRIQGLVAPGPSMRPIACSSATPSGASSAFQLGEEGAVMVDADMLEHADRDDAVILSGLLAVVAQMKPDPVGEPGGGGAPRRDLVLLDRQRQPGDVDAAFAGEIEREAAPAASRCRAPSARAGAAALPRCAASC